MAGTLNEAIKDAVTLVNSHSGETSVWLSFEDDPVGIDFVANAARVSGNRFEFQSGFETYSGSFEELAGIRAEVIRH